MSPAEAGLIIMAAALLLCLRRRRSTTWDAMTHAERHAMDAATLDTETWREGL